MKKSLLILIACFTLFSFSPVQAETVTKKDIQLRDDVILDLLFPSIYKAIEKTFWQTEAVLLRNRFSKSKRR